MEFIALPIKQKTTAFIVERHFHKFEIEMEIWQRWFSIGLKAYRYVVCRVCGWLAYVEMHKNIGSAHIKNIGLCFTSILQIANVLYAYSTPKLLMACRFLFRRKCDFYEH